MKVLYATDLDGTLLDPTAHLSAESARMFNNLKAEGALITFITARTPATVDTIMAEALPALPGVAMTGAALWNPTTRHYESVSYHKSDDAKTILDICRRHDIYPFVYTLPKGSNSLVVYHEAPECTPIEKRFIDDRTLNDLKTFKLKTAAPPHASEITVLFFAMGDPKNIRQAAEDITAHTDCYASWYPDTYHPGLSLLEIFTSGVSKASGLHQLKGLVKADKVVAFGDNLNDIPMLREADFAVAVENAHPDVKAVADLIIGPSYTDAVMHFITEDFHNGYQYSSAADANTN